MLLNYSSYLGFKCNVCVRCLGSRAGVEDWSEAAGDNIQVTDCRDYRGEDLPQVSLVSMLVLCSRITAQTK